MTTVKQVVVALLALAMCKYLETHGYNWTFFIGCIGGYPMKQRIFARGIRKFVTIEMVSDNSGPVEAANLTLLEDDTNPVMTMQWHLEGKEDIGAALIAIKEKRLDSLMDVLDNYTGTLPNMQVEPQL